MDHKLTQSPEARAAHSELMSAFEAFRDANDQRLAEIEKKSSADVLLEEKVDRIDRSLNRAQTALDRLALTGLRPNQPGPTRDGSSRSQSGVGGLYAPWRRDGSRTN